MTLDAAVMRFAGIVILLSVLLAVYASQWWLALTAFVGLNLFQASFTGFCPVAKLLQRLGVKPGELFR